MRSKLTKILIGSILGSSLLTLGGCGVLPFGDINRQQKETAEYNKLVDGTLESYTKATVFGKDHQRDLLAYVTQDKDWGLVVSDSDLPKLDSTQLANFSSGYNVAYNDYMTSLGSDTSQQSLILTTKGYSMHVSVIWTATGVNGITRVVSVK